MITRNQMTTSTTNRKKTKCHTCSKSTDLISLCVGETGERICRPCWTLSTFSAFSACSAFSVIQKKDRSITIFHEKDYPNVDSLE